MQGTISKSTLNKGAQPGNTNGLRHGLRSSGSVIDVRLALGSMPKALKRVEREVNRFRRMIEAATLEAHGVIDVYRAALIQSASRHELHAQMVARWLRLQEEALDPSQRLAYSKAVADASTARDKCLERLGLQPRNAASAYEDWLAKPEPPAIEHQSDGATNADA